MATDGQLLAWDHALGWWCLACGVTVIWLCCDYGCGCAVIAGLWLWLWLWLWLCPPHEHPFPPFSLSLSLACLSRCLSLPPSLPPSIPIDAPRRGRAHSTCQLQGSHDVWPSPPPAAEHDALAGNRQVVLNGKVSLYCSGRGSIVSCDMCHHRSR